MTAPPAHWASQNLKPGLYVTATPIGHPDDVSGRALQVLAQADWLCVEDTRETQRLLQALGIQRPAGRMRSLHAHNEARQIPEVLALLGQSLSVGLVSDAGTPGISDPGARLVQATWAAGHRVVPVPGPSAVIAAASVSGFLTDPDRPLTFWGFLPARSAQRQARLLEIGRQAGVSVCFEAPHRIHESLADAEAILGDGCEMMLAREMTKPYERLIRGRPAALRAQLSADLAQDAHADRGEMVLVFAPAARGAPALSLEDKAAWQALLTGELPKPKAAKLLVGALGISREEAYELLLRAPRRLFESGD